jgi:hypothetical protein
LGRWFERNGLRDHSLLLRDLTVLADVADDRDAVATADGFWLGVVRPMKDVKRRALPVRNVRTWVTEDWRDEGG